ncbi:MAG TPA: DMT family transporter [Pyrinomonadaceae bacterium]|nr:DMT family transporter [Pyrinomonadaceae bacterium]
MRFKGNLAADGALVLTTLIWGSTFVLAKEILESWPPVAYITVRFALASVLLVLLFPKQILRARLLEWKMGGTLGLLMGGGFALQAVGQVYTTPSKSAFVTGLTTPLVPFVALLILRVRPNLENLIGVTLASIGGMLILAPQGSEPMNTGDLLTLVATTLFAAHITLMSAYAREIDVRQLTVLQITSAAILFVMVWAALRAAGATLPVSSLPGFITRENVELAWTARVATQLLYLAAVATVVTFLIWTWGQSKVSATHAAIIFSLEPVFATLFAVAVRGSSEWMTARGNLGAALILTGVIISEIHLGRRSRRREQVGETEEEETGDISIDEELAEEERERN